MASSFKTPRELGIPLAGKPGKYNALTDVPGVEVGYTTIISGNGKLMTGRGPVRTGVTAVLPRGKQYNPVFAATSVLNGNGEMTGAIWIEESGFLETPVLLTNTHSVGVVRDAALEWMIRDTMTDPNRGGSLWLLPVVAETYDGFLNDINGFHVAKQHVFDALDSAAPGTIAQGNVGGGTGMICHGFKGGTGSASRLVRCGGADYTLGVMVQANHGRREQLTIAGVPIGQKLKSGRAELHGLHAGGEGSIIVIIATDAPLLPHQLKRLARRVPMGIARTGGIGEHTSGDIFLAFSTADSGAARGSGPAKIDMFSNDEMTPLFEAVVCGVEEAILNALFAAETMSGINNNRVYKLPIDEVMGFLAGCKE